MVNRRFYHKILIIILIFTIFTSSCFASTTSNMIDGMKSLSSIDEIYNYIKTTFGSDGSNVTNSFLNGILQAINKRLSTVQNIVWVDFATRNIHGVPGDLSDYMYRDSNTQTSIYSKLNEFYDRYYTYSDGNAALLNQINTNTINMYGSQSAANIQLANLNSKTSWTNISFDPLYKDNNLNNVTKSDWQVVTNPFYMQLPNYSRSDVIFRVWMPITYQGYPNNSNFSVELAMYQNGVTILPENIYAQASQYGTEVYFIAPYLSSQQSLYLKISNTAGLRFSNSSPIFQVLDSSNIMYPQYLSFFQYKKLINKADDIVDAINNITVNPEVSVDINNTITDNDLTLDVDLPDNANNDTSNLLNKLKQLMLTGINTNMLLNAIDDVELHAWYSQSNKDVVEALNNQYTNLYD